MYDPTVGRWISADPISFKGEDANLYRYVGNSPTNATDPMGRKIEFTQSPNSLPKLDSTPGFTMSFNETITLPGAPLGTYSQRGMQKWRTNKVAILAYVYSEKTSTCHQVSSVQHILDVSNIGAMPFPIQTTDTVGTMWNGVGEEDGLSVVFQSEETRKKAGFRSYQSDASGNFVRFTEPPLPVPDPDKSSMYEATEDQWNRAKRMSEPFIETRYRYAFIDHAKLMSCCSDEVAQKVKELYELSTGHAVPGDLSKSEGLQYQGLDNKTRQWKNLFSDIVFIYNGPESPVD
jgi:hypothetical protein